MTDREELALQVIDLAKAALLAENHFLSSAVGRLHMAPMQLTTSFSTDGYFLAYDQRHILARFKRAGLPPKRNLLHSVAHCLFLHPYVSASVDQPLWNLACDIAAERVVNDLLGPLPDEKGTRVSLMLQQVERDLGSRISAEKVYRRLREGWWADCAGEWMGLSHADSHDMWYAPATSGDDKSGEGAGQGTQPSGGVGTVEGNADSTQTQTGQEGELKNTEGDVTQDRLENPQGSSDGDHDSGSASSARSREEASPQERDSDSSPEEEPHQEQTNGQEAHGDISQQPKSASSSDADDSTHTHRARGWEHGTGTGDLVETVIAPNEHLGLRQQTQPSPKQQKDEWRQVAISLAVNLQTLSARHGGRLSGFVEDLQDSSRPHADYVAFLRQFTTPGEVMRISDEEFDHVFYTYGMQLYGDTPLIEPLEYREERRVREFVIVIDTSASVQGDIVRSFVATTFDILKESEAFFDHVHVRILQCDTEVRTDDRLENVDDLDQWGRSMRVIGGGGTDFRPAFAYVDSLVERGEFFDLSGLVYFTDGFGTYPERMPSYRTAFVFYDEDRHGVAVPPWAVQIVLDSDTIRDAESSRTTWKECIGA